MSNRDIFTEEGEAHLMELSKLAEKDPEFFKYLQENDKELLDFNPDNVGEVDSDDEMASAGEDGSMEDNKIPILTKQHLRQWQKALLEVSAATTVYGILINIIIATFTSCTEKTPRCFPFSSTYKRR